MFYTRADCRWFYPLYLLLISLSVSLGSVIVWSQATDALQPTAQTSATGQSTDTDLTTGNWISFRGNAQSSGYAEGRTSDALVPVWKFELKDGGFESAAAIIKNPKSATVFIAGVTNDVKGKLYALDLRDGKQLWEFESPDGFLTTPVYDNGRLFLGDMAGMFFAVDAQGKKLWTYETETEVTSSANIYQDKILFGSQDGALYALNKQTGAFVWKHTTDDQIQCSVTVAKDKAFLAGCDSKLHVINLDTGKEVGNIELSSPTISTPAAKGETVFFGIEKGDFLSVDAATLKTAWLWEEPLGGSAVRSSAALAEGHVVFGARNRKLYSFHPETGKENWATTLKNKIDSSPVIVKNRVIAASTDGRLYLLNLADGKLLWQKQFNGGFTGSPAFAHNHLIVATDSGTVHALKFK